MGLAGGSDHPLGWAPRPPQAGAPGYCRSSTAHCRQAVRQCIAGGPLPTAPGQSGSVLQELHCPLPPSSGAVHCRSSTAHCPQAVRQCIAGVPLSTAPRQWGSALQEVHCPLPPGSAAVHCRSSTAHCPLPTTTVQQGTHSAVWCRAPSRVHHTEGTGGAARHAGCSGQMRPCVTARRRRQGSVGQVRECTGPAMPQHTYTQRAHNTHSPARLPVPVGRHPGLCPLVTAPSAQHNTTQHNTTQNLWLLVLPWGGQRGGGYLFRSVLGLC